MEQLQRLAETIAETYIRDRIREHGNAQFTHNGKTGEIRRELLASGLVDNCVYAARSSGKADYERKAYTMLMEMISLDGREYQVTNHGLNVIENMHRIALAKTALRVSH
ncbi:hypothetical protein N3553_12230 [Pantoea dispersa]|uniref:hypothetical protein n=1 Tax=Pantoea TaxID=53335 RepID=UPI0021AFF499|nr:MULTISPECIES: hypothetical protein [Pantoea]MCT6590651.1 hypothetical protein [Pantoea dispersa]MDU4125533.1 hypothetical protein [Pantoea sp.]